MLFLSYYLKFIFSQLYIKKKGILLVLLSDNVINKMLYHQV